MKTKTSSYSTFTKRPDVVEAIQWNGKNTDEVITFGTKHQEPDVEVTQVQVNPMVPDKLSVQTAAAFVEAEQGDYVVKDKDGNLSVLSEEDFSNQYEASAGAKAKATNKAVEVEDPKHLSVAQEEQKAASTPKPEKASETAASKKSK